jgi:hypothetical protein
MLARPGICFDWRLVLSAVASRYPKNLEHRLHEYAGLPWLSGFNKSTTSLPKHPCENARVATQEPQPCPKT